MNRLAAILFSAHADHIGHGAQELRRGISAPVLLVYLVRVVSWVFLVCLVFWSLWFLWLANRHPADKRNKLDEQAGLSGPFRSTNHTDQTDQTNKTDQSR
jgi:hypothetical protein